MRFSYLLAVAGTVMAILGAGCQTYKSQSKSMAGAWAAGNAEQAAKEFGEKADSVIGG